MVIFANSDGILTKVKEVPFNLERDIQKITEDNLQAIFNLQMVRHKFGLNDLEMDTLAFDSEINAFVVIEYKRDKNFSVIDQGYAYLSLMLNNKAEVILAYKENVGSIKRDDIDWAQSRVIFISPSFTRYQQQAINFKDLPIELWEVKQFDNKTILFNKLKSPDSVESINKITKHSEVIERVSKEIKVYTEEEHLSHGSEMIQETYNELKATILNLGNDIEIKPKKLYIAFKAKTNFVDIEIQKNQLKCTINLLVGEISDPTNIARDVSNIGRWGNGDYQVILSSSDKIPELMNLVKQSYLKNR